MKIKVHKKSKRIDNVRSAVKKLNGASVEAGWFDQQGQHYSGYKYVELANIFEYGRLVQKEDGTSIWIPPRSLLLKSSKSFHSKLKTSRQVKQAWKQWKKQLGKGGAINQNGFLDAIGRLAQSEIKSYIGNPAKLAPNAPLTIAIKGDNTPLEDTGDFKSKVAYRQSYNKKLKE